MKQKVSNRQRINEATDINPCLISLFESCRDMLAEPAPYLIRGTSLKVIERLRQLGWKHEKGLSGLLKMFGVNNQMWIN